MSDGSRETPMVTAGVDLGDKYSYLYLLDIQSGEVLKVGRVRTTPEAFKQRFDSEQQPLRIAIEAGTHSPWVSRLLEELGHEVLVANPRKIRLIYANRRKSDKLDAENLARLTRVDAKLLYPLKHRGEDSQAHLAIIRSREALVGSRANKVTSENKPNRAGVLRRIAQSDHCLCVSNPRCRRTSWKVTSSCQRITNQQTIFLGSAPRSVQSALEVLERHSVGRPCGRRKWLRIVGRPPSLPRPARWSTSFMRRRRRGTQARSRRSAWWFAVRALSLTASHRLGSSAYPRSQPRANRKPQGDGSPHQPCGRVCVDLDSILEWRL
jgi:Transposase